MSEATRCNYCTLQEMRRRAEDRGATVVLEQEPPGIDGRRWVSARYSDQGRPAAHFMDLRERCSC